MLTILITESNQKINETVVLKLFWLWILQGAAVAYVADLLKIPVVFLKAVTDLVDGDKPTAEEFLQNLTVVTAALEGTATKVINFINGRNLSDL